MKTETAVKKKAREKRSGIDIGQLMMACMLLLMTVIIICIVYSGKVTNNVWGKSKEGLEAASKACAHRFEDQLEGYMDMVQAAVHGMPDCKEVLNTENLKIFDMFTQIDYVYSAYLVDVSGTAVDYQGAAAELKENKLVKNILKSGRPGYSELTYGINGDQAVIFVGAPVYDENKIITGVGMIAVKASVFSDNISESMIVGKGTCVLIDKNGVIADVYKGKPSQLKGVENLFTYLEDAEYPEKEGYTRLINEIAIKKTNQQKIKKAGKDYYICYAPVRSIEGYLLTVYEYEDVCEMLGAIEKNTIYMLITVLISFMVYSVAVLMINMLAARRVENKNKELEEKAEVDALTTLYNKAATEKYIRNYLENEGKNIRSLLFVIDVDNFKSINDTKGHAFGDIVLNSIGKNLSLEFRVTDIIGRIGGDEFLVFLKHIPNHEIEVKEAEKIVKFFHELNPGEYVKTKVTASIGAAVYPDDATDFETLYKAADEAVYKTKKRGKDGYSFYNEKFK